MADAVTNTPESADYLTARFVSINRNAKIERTARSPASSKSKLAELDKFVLFLREAELVSRGATKKNHDT